MTDVTLTQPTDDEEWRTYDEFAAGIDTYRLPNTGLAGTSFGVTLSDGTALDFSFDEDVVTWQASGSINAEVGTRDPYDAVHVRHSVVFVNLPRTSVEREALTLVYSTLTNRVSVVHSLIGEDDASGTPRVKQTFWAGTVNGQDVSSEAPGPSRDLIGKRNLYRYSPEHLYEHVYVSSQRYAWQCLEGVQRGHGDMDLSTVWKFDDGLYLFCFREFRIAVASVWLHDLGYDLRTTGIFLGLNGSGDSEHSRAGGHIYPIGSVDYPDAQPV